MHSIKGAVVALAYATACGSSGDDSPPDATTPDTTAPHIASSSPAHGAKPVSVIAPIAITFDEPLDPATVTPATFQLISHVYGGNTIVKATVAYDPDTSTVTITPNLPLLWDADHDVAIAPAVSDVAGNAFAGQSIRFRTYTNSYMRVVNYNTGNAAVTTWQRWVLDTTGRPVVAVAYNGAGPNATWLDADDVGYSHTTSVYDADGHRTTYRSFGAGPDAKYDTADDVIANETRDVYDGNGHFVLETVVTGPGADAMWGTSDDAISEQYALTYDAAGNIDSQTEYAGAGPDGKWGTADDVIASRGLYQYQGTLLTITKVYTGTGPDGVWKTADDLGSWYESHYDASGFLDRTIHRLAGPNGTIMDADDVIADHTDYVHDAAGNTVRFAQVGAGAGPDGIWLTADDGVSYYYTYTFDAAGAMTNTVGHNAIGADNTWFTADDITTSHLTFRYDAHHLSSGSDSFGPGADTIYGTADDPYVSHRETDYDATGNRLSNRVYGTAGPDGLWKTADDRLSYVYDYDPTH